MKSGEIPDEIQGEFKTLEPATEKSSMEQRSSRTVFNRAV